MLAETCVIYYRLGMAFIVLRRSRNTRSYYLVESYRDDQGETRRRTLCYLGREQDGTDTLAKALAHWEHVKEQGKRELRKAKDGRRQVIRRRIKANATRIGVITEHIGYGRYFWLTVILGLPALMLIPIVFWV